METRAPGKKIPAVLWAAAGAAAAWVLFRYAFRWIGPFLLAYLTAALLEKPVELLSRRANWKRAYASVFLTALFFLLLGVTVWLLLRRLTREAEAFLRRLPELAQAAYSALDRIRASARGAAGALPEELRRAWAQALDALEESLAALPGTLLARLPGLASAVVKKAPAAFLFAATYAAGTFFLGTGFPQVRSFLLRQLPDRLRDGAGGLRSEAVSALTGWLGAQVRLMTLTFLEMTAGFWLLRVEWPALLALLVAAVDALPVLGTGTVLLPWAAAELLGGNGVRAAALGLLYLVSVLVRSFLEPRLIGRRANLPPAASLFAMYSGFCLAGVAGMILFPLTLLVLKQLADKGHVRLWR